MEQIQKSLMSLRQRQLYVCGWMPPAPCSAQGKMCVGTGKAISATLKQKAPPQAVRIALETGPLSAWHWRALSKLGLPVVCIDARHAKAALAMQVNKTGCERRIFGLAQIVPDRGGYREQCGSRVSKAIAPGRTARSAEQTRRYAKATFQNQLRGLLKVFWSTSSSRPGVKVSETWARTLAEGDPRAVYDVRGAFGDVRRLAHAEQIARLDKLLLTQARQDPTCRH